MKLTVKPWHGIEQPAAWPIFSSRLVSFSRVKLCMYRVINALINGKIGVRCNTYFLLVCTSTFCNIFPHFLFYECMFVPRFVVAHQNSAYLLSPWCRNIHYSFTWHQWKFSASPIRRLNKLRNPSLRESRACLSDVLWSAVQCRLGWNEQLHYAACNTKALWTV